MKCEDCKHFVEEGECDCAIPRWVYSLIKKQRPWEHINGSESFDLCECFTKDPYSVMPILERIRGKVSEDKK